VTARLFKYIKDIDSEGGERRDVQAIAREIQSKLTEEGCFTLLCWLIPQLLDSDDLCDETLCLLADVAEEHE